MSEVSEATTIHTSLKSYYEDQGIYVASGGMPPDLQNLIADMEYKELLSFSVKEADGGSSFDIGSAQESISTAAAILREIDMCTFRKSTIYDSHADELSLLSTYYGQSGDFHVGILKGNPTNGSQC
jgi:hypothetical protein